MFHAYIIPIATCFIYTLYHFYAFSGTNLFTRCHSASSCFMLFLVPEKLFCEYSRNCTKQRPKSLFFQHVHGVRRRDEGGHRGAQTTPRRGWPPCRANRWCGPLGPPPTLPLRLFIPSDAKTLKDEAIFPEEFRSAAAIDDKFRGTEVSVPARCRDGELPPEPSPSTPPPSSSPLLIPMMRRE